MNILSLEKMAFRKKTFGKNTLKKLTLENLDVKKGLETVEDIKIPTSLLKMRIF